MALLNFADHRARAQRNLRPGLYATKVKPQTWPTALLEFIGTFAVLIAIAGGVLMLRFGLIVLHDLVR